MLKIGLPGWHQQIAGQRPGSLISSLLGSGQVEVNGHFGRMLLTTTKRDALWVTQEIKDDERNS